METTGKIAKCLCRLSGFYCSPGTRTCYSSDGAGTIESPQFQIRTQAATEHAMAPPVHCNTPVALSKQAIPKQVRSSRSSKWGAARMNERTQSTVNLWLCDWWCMIKEFKQCDCLRQASNWHCLFRLELVKYRQISLPMCFVLRQAWFVNHRHVCMVIRLQTCHGIINFGVKCMRLASWKTVFGCVQSCVYVYAM